jgi:hypothetical protein
MNITAAELEESYGHRGGRWTVARDGGIWDAMTGYGFPWAMATADWIGKPSFVCSVTVTFIDLESGERVTAEVKA